MVVAAGGILLNSVRPNPCVYIPADGGLGLLYTVLLTTFARISGQVIFIHHHSFSAIDRPQRLMTALVSVAGSSATHVFLCDLMQRRFQENYHGAWRALISSNAVHLPELSRMSARDGGAVRLGLLSNLTREKGLYVFLDVLRGCLARGIPVYGLLAGPTENTTDAAAIEAARVELGEHLNYVGPVYEADKDRFLSELDVFVFPTSYRNEAQPNAIFEAMAAGAAVVVFARGCIGVDVSGDCGLLIDPSDEFVSAACAQIARWNDDPAALVATKNASRKRFAERKECAAEGYQDLLYAVAGVAPRAA
ncbi:glycosyltransferase [Bradyrhizobium sp. 62]|uniref:glycosyltransferase n=1 Tax=Bradyrhizobium sp. 62 TaxID=1043588 RepID=UPI001FFB70BF